MLGGCAWGLEQTVAPTVEPLSVDEARQHLRIDTIDEDSYLSSLIKAARSYCEDRLRMQLVTATWRLSLDRWPISWVIRLPQPPLISVSSITYVDADGATQTLSSSVYQVDASRRPGVVQPAYDQVFPEVRIQPQSIKITYTAGYGAAASAVPESIRSAIRLLVGHWYENREAAGERQRHNLPLAVESLLAGERCYEVC